VKSLLAPLAALASVGVLFWTCGGAFFADVRPRGNRVRISVYGFSVIAEPLRERIFPAFRTQWLARTGEEVEFSDSFAASGTVANQITFGAPADIAILACPGDADRIVASGMALRSWREGPHGGILNRTAVVIAFRAGNPHRICSFADLARDDLKIVHPDPLTSGGAQWAILAEYAAPILAARAEGRAPAPEAAERGLLAIWRNVVAQAPSARAANMQFDTGFGDVLITYEVEALLDLRQGRAIEYVVPPATILAEHPVVLVDHNIDPRERPAVEGFARYLWTEEAQRIFVDYGFRSVLPGLDDANPKLRPIPCAFTVADLGGWSRAREEIVDRIWEHRILPGVRD
jgi:sulfate transport system substrate-binding protein